MFHVELAPLGGVLGPLKSDLGVFWAKIPLYPYNVKFSNSIFSKSPNLPILGFWILNLHIIICQFQKRSTKKHFFVSLHVHATCEESENNQLVISFIQMKVPLECQSAFAIVQRIVQIWSCHTLTNCSLEVMERVEKEQAIANIYLHQT